jgi:predicted dehydrogenase
MPDLGKSYKALVSDDMARIAADRPQSKTHKARIGFIGVGWWATTNHIPMLRARSDVELVSVCGLDKAVNERIKRDFGVSHSTRNPQELLEQKLDGVIVASPHGLHAEHTLAALNAGCHVMVEKPMAISSADAKKMVQTAREKKRHLSVSFGWNHRPLTVKAKEVLKTGELGEIEYVSCFLGSPSKELFAGRSCDFAKGAYVEPSLATYVDPKISGGGFGQGQLTHALGLLFHLADLEPKSVFCRMSCEGAPSDMHNAIVVGFDRGRIGTVGGTATVPIGSPYQLDIRIFGSGGMLLYDIERERLELHTHDGKHKVVAVEAGEGAYRCDGPPHQLVELILGLTDQNNAPGELGLKTVQVLEAAYRSANSGRDEVIS